MFFKKKDNVSRDAEQIAQDVEKFFFSGRYRKIKKIEDEYYTQMKRVQEAWSVLYNLKAYDSSQGRAFEALCIDNAKNYHAMREAEEGTPLEDDREYSVPAYTRLAMLYERRGEYDKAIEVCVDSIKARWVKGEYARLARMIKKSKKEASAEVLALLEGEQ